MKKGGLKEVPAWNIDGKFQKVEESIERMSNVRRQLEAWLKTIDVKADCVLDVGGAQLPVKGRTKSWEVKEEDLAKHMEYLREMHAQNVPKEGSQEKEKVLPKLDDEFAEIYGR